MIKTILSIKKRSIFFYFMLCLPIIFIQIENATAQQIDAQVKLMLERLPIDKQQKLNRFSEDIETYLNSYDYTGESLDQKIPVTVQIFLTDNSVSYEDRYTGNFLISNNSDIQYYDKYWQFPYQAGDPLVHNENNYDPFTGFLDFYIYLIIGNEYDKYGKLLGTSFFEKAKQISEQAKFESRFIKGWRERSEIIENILSDTFKPYRFMKDIYFLGLSYLSDEDSTAMAYCSKAVDMMGTILKKDPEHKETLQFLQAHHIELIHLFQDDAQTLEKLIAIDPEHADTYREHIKK